MKNSVMAVGQRILPTSERSIELVRKLSELSSQITQEEIITSHILHGGMYSRSVKIKSGTVITGALIKISTLLIIEGDASIYTEGTTTEYYRYNILACSAYRKQAILALSDINLTMIFPSKAKTVEEAEKEFTDETDLLLSHKQSYNNTVMITGE